QERFYGIGADLHAVRDFLAAESLKEVVHGFAFALSETELVSQLRCVERRFDAALDQNRDRRSIAVSLGLQLEGAAPVDSLAGDHGGHDRQLREVRLLPEQRPDSLLQSGIGGSRSLRIVGIPENVQCVGIDVNDLEARPEEYQSISRRVHLT